ncbi:MAG TPA: glutamate synthase subunit beta, partial [Tepidisphaeraceae bacterium]|nr:glutamate synthase subunit beta [Tepidisphaeraceae bacterium]
FTGRVCPAPCEEACVLSVNDKPVTIKNVEVSIIEHAFAQGWVKPEPPAGRSGKKVAVIGSGPAGLAAAAQLNKAGHWVTVFERADRIGGLLAYGIPEFKLEKRIVERRVQLLEAEGVKFVTNANVHSPAKSSPKVPAGAPGAGVTAGQTPSPQPLPGIAGGGVNIDSLRKEFDAIVLCIGSTKPRDLAVPGRELGGIHFAMDYLPQANNAALGALVPNQIVAKDKHVIILGGGDTGADCLGTAIRQGCKSVKQFELLARPADARSDEGVLKGDVAPWPYWPMVYRVSSAHEEAAAIAGADIRDFAINTKAFKGENGVVTRLVGVRLEWSKDDSGRPVMKEIAGSEFELECDLCFLAMGFVGPEKPGPVEQLGLKLDARGNVIVDENYQTSVPGVFAAGDCRRGQSLIVWAISEGRCAAAGVDQFLMGRTDLPRMKLF